MKAKKKYGQHFLNSEKYILQIASHIVSFNEEYSRVLEVGPGRGALTQKIYKEFEDFLAVEIDKDVIPILHNQMPGLKNKILNDDFLKINIQSVFDGKPFVLTGNYPYNISSQIIFKMLDHKNQIPVMLGMFQKEVADRVVSGPGSKVYGILSVLTQFHYKAEILLDLEPEAFTPPPKVMSSVICLTSHNNYAGTTDEKLFKTVVKTSFNHRRKMLRNTLKGFFEDKEVLSEDIFLKRPEHLSIKDFIYITNLISNKRHDPRRENKQ